MTTKKTNNDVSIVDQMADDVDSVELPTEYPPGTPEFKVMLAIRPRSRRAEFKRLLAQIAERNPELRKAQAEIAKIKDSALRDAANMRLWADMDEMYETIEKALRLAAIDVEKYDAWAEEVDDNDLQVTWAVYQQKAQPGEAQSSTS